MRESGWARLSRICRRTRLFSVRCIGWVREGMQRYVDWQVVPAGANRRTIYSSGWVTASLPGVPCSTLE